MSLLDHVLTRRQAFRAAGLAVNGYWFLPLVKPLGVRAAGKVTPRGNARFVVFVMLDGGQSHVDAWDLKEGKWTPPDFEVREIQRRSRIDSGGAVTISGALADAVARGDVSLGDAIEQQRRRDRRS